MVKPQAGQLRLERINEMKKKVLLIMGLSLMLLAGGCTKNPSNIISGDKSDVTVTPATTDTSDEAATAITIPPKEVYNVDDYFKLGQYKGIEVSVDKVIVTDASVDAEIAYELENAKSLVEITDRDVVQTGDVANIDYEGLKDGVAFDGGTATGSDLEIGSGSFIEGFEEGLIGKKVGEKVEIDLSFPEDYGVEELAGQAVVFNVTINKIQKYVIPELTEDYVKNNTDYDSIAAYKKTIKENMEAANESSAQSEISSGVLEKVVSNSTITSYPQSLLDYYSASYENYVTQTVYNNFGMTLSQYFDAIGSTREDFDANLVQISQSYAGLEMAQRAIAKAEGMTVTDADYSSKIAQYVKDYSAASEEELLSHITKEDIMDDILLKKALEFAVDNAKVTKNDVTPTPAPTPVATPTAAAQ
jgi:trigger factor